MACVLCRHVDSPKLDGVLCRFLFCDRDHGDTATERGRRRREGEEQLQKVPRNGGHLLPRWKLAVRRTRAVGHKGEEEVGDQRR